MKFWKRNEKLRGLVKSKHGSNTHSSENYEAHKHILQRGVDPFLKLSSKSNPTALLDKVSVVLMGIRHLTETGREAGQNTPPQDLSQLCNQRRVELPKSTKADKLSATHWGTQLTINTA